MLNSKYTTAIKKKKKRENDGWEIDWNQDIIINNAADKSL